MAGLEIVDISAETADIDFDEIKPTSRNSGGFSSKPSVNFGGGIELLMNTSRKNKDANSSNHNSEADLEDLKALSAELDNDSGFSNQPRSSFRKAQSSIFDNLGKSDSKDDDKPISIKFADDDKNDSGDDEPVPSLSFVKENSNAENTKTWDGYQRFSTVPNANTDSSARLSKEDLLREKFIYLRKLEALQQKGVKLTKMYSMESSLDEMKGEYEMIISEKEKDNSIKFQGKMLMMCITGLEYLNNKFDPFDVKLDGWTEQVSENLTDYDEIFSELHEKYRSKAKMAPELKLLFQLGGSAIMLHMTNTMFKSAMPSMDDIMRQNPELMRQFTQAAATSMTDNSPGFGGFMNSLLGGGGSGNSGPSNYRSEPSPMQMGPPPPAMSTKQSHPGRAGGIPSMMPIQQQQGGFNQSTNPRSAMSAALGDNNQYGNSGRPDLDAVRPQSSNNSVPPERSARVQRNEMKGPSDISDILQGLKTKKINIQQNNKDGSTISASDLNEMNGEKVVKSKRRPKSEKNTVSLDI